MEYSGVRRCDTKTSRTRGTVGNGATRGNGAMRGIDASRLEAAA